MAYIILDPEFREKERNSVKKKGSMRSNGVGIKGINAQHWC